MEHLKEWTKCDLCGEKFKCVLNSVICLNCGRMLLDEKTISAALETIDVFMKNNEQKISEYNKLLCTKQFYKLDENEQKLIIFLKLLNANREIIRKFCGKTTKSNNQAELYDLLLKLDSYSQELKMSNQ